MNYQRKTQTGDKIDSEALESPLNQTLMSWLAWPECFLV